MKLYTIPEIEHICPKCSHRITVDENNIYVEKKNSDSKRFYPCYSGKCPNCGHIVYLENHIVPSSLHSKALVNSQKFQG